jgi:AraC-like DNA-binding protein
MYLRFHSPCASIAAFADRLIVSDYEVARELSLKPWPTGHIYAIWFFGDLDGYSVSVDGHHHLFDCPFWLAGQIEYQDVRVSMRRQACAVVAELEAQAFWRLFGRNGRWLTGRTCGPADISAQFAAVVNAVVARTPANRDGALAGMTEILEYAAQAARPADTLVSGAVSMLRDAHGRASIAGIARDLGVTQRHLARRFGDVVGLAPKIYARVLQINQVIDMLYAPMMGNLAHIAADSGFYDQSHLNRAMRLFFNEGPGAFLRSDHALFRSFLECMPETD